MESALTSREPAARLPDVEKYKGERGEALENFLYELRLRHRYAPTLFSNEQRKIDDAALHLSGTPLQWFRQVESTAPNNQPFHTFEEFLTNLRANYGEVDALRRYRDEFDSLQQSKSAADYVARFNLLASRLSLTQEDKLYRFKKGLKGELRIRLAGSLSNDALAVVQEKSIEMDNALWDTDPSYRRRHVAPTSGRSITQTHLQPGPGPTYQFQRQHSTLSNNHRNDPMIIDTLQRPAGSFGPISAAEKSRRFQEGLCLYCGKSGHQATLCPNKPKNVVRGATLRQ